MKADAEISRFSVIVRESRDVGVGVGMSGSGVWGVKRQRSDR